MTETPSNVLTKSEAHKSAEERFAREAAQAIVDGRGPELIALLDAVIARTTPTAK